MIKVKGHLRARARVDGDECYYIRVDKKARTAGVFHVTSKNLRATPRLRGRSRVNQGKGALQMSAAEIKHQVGHWVIAALT